MTTLAIIPAKSNSLRIPQKNIRQFMGKPMMAHSILAAKESRLFKNIIVSTDSEEIAEIAQSYGADVMMRGERWCRDDVGPIDVARHCLSLMGPEVSVVCTLYATAPLMAVADLVRGYHELQRDGIMFAISIGATPFFHDSAQFVWSRARALREGAPEIAPHTAIVPIAPERDCDLNTLDDLARCEAMYAALYGDDDTGVLTARAPWEDAA